MHFSNMRTFHEGIEMILAPIIQDFMHFMKLHGLSTSQVHALMYIYHTGECQVSDIGTLAGASNAAASQLVERLVQQGLVERKEDPANRRTKILRLTEKGESLIRGNVPRNHFLIAVLDSLSDDQRKTVQSAFDILTQAAQRLQAYNQQKEDNHA